MSMDVYHLRIFQREVARQCDFALMAYNDLEQALNQLKRVGMLEADLMNRIWYYIQNLLIAAANISKLLWPRKQKFQVRGRQLRSSLNVPQNSSLEPRTFRNHFEHFDERLEEWISSSRTQGFIDSNIGGPLPRGADTKDYLRNLDDVNYILTFWGESYQLKQILQEIKTITQIARTEADRSP
jgi:hypothetical protein